MLIIDCFNHNIFIEDKLVGYIGENTLIVNGNKIADLSDDGIISIGEKEIGFIDDDGTVIIKGKESGYIDEKNNLVFYKGISLKNNA